MADNFSLIVDSELKKGSVEKLERQIKSHKYTIDIDFNSGNLKNITTELNKKIKDLSINFDEILKHSSKSIEKIPKEFERINQEMSKVANYDYLDKGRLKTVQDGTRYIETYKNALGDVIQRESIFDEKNKLVNSSTKTLENGIKNITTTTNKYNTVLNGITTKITDVSKVTTDTAGKTQTIITRTKEWTDANGKLHKSVVNLNEKGKEISATTENVTDNVKKVGTASETSSKQVKSLGQSFVETTLKVAKFYASTLVIQAFMSTINEAKEAIIEFDKAMVEFQKVSDLRGQALDEYTQKLGEMGEAVARTKVEMLNASTEFKKSGFTDEQSAQLAKIASLYQNIADEELSTADASKVVISQMKAFAFETEAQAEHIVDAINEVSNNFAVSSGDIGRGLTQAGASLSTYGNTFEETIGLVSAGTEIFQGKSQQVKTSCLLNIA